MLQVAHIRCRSERGGLRASFFFGEGGPDLWDIRGIVDKVGAVLRRTSKAISSTFRAKGWQHSFRRSRRLSMEAGERAA
jgi:hypothetical protein